MTRFFFDFRQAGQLVPDSEGIEFESVEQAYLEAFKTGQEMWSELLKQRHDPRRCSFEVRNAAGDVLFIFPFLEVIEACNDRPVSPLRQTFREVAETYNYTRRVRDEMAELVQESRKMLRDSREMLRDSRALLAEE